MKKRTIKKVVVLGGGTAGWLTALYLKSIMPNKDITVVESEEIGILGAGEGTTPHLINLLDMLDIPVSRLVRETSTTIKNGIKFTNWNNNGAKDFYYHPFALYGNAAPEHCDANSYVTSIPGVYPAVVSTGDHINDSNLAAKALEQNKVLFLDKETNNKDINPIHNYEAVGHLAIHFDASKFAELLRKIATEERGISRIEGKVTDFTAGSNGDVKSLTLTSSELVPCDFIFDCSGFARFFPKAFKTEWVSHAENLPVDSALPFFLDMEEDSIPAYTESIAMKYGWAWKIPLQHRYGCGYVYDSTLITQEEVREEIVKIFGSDIKFPRETPIKFEPGYYKEPWKHNVISLGLSAGFIEPLEATSIWSSLATLKTALSNSESLYNIDSRIVDDYNKESVRFSEQIADFVYYHYMSNRDDTEFWKKFTYKNAPSGLKKLLDILDYRAWTREDLDHGIWSSVSWYHITFGIKNNKAIEHLRDYDFYNPASDFYKERYVEMKGTQDRLANDYLVTHKDFLEALKGE